MCLKQCLYSIEKQHGSCVIPRYGVSRDNDVAALPIFIKRIEQESLAEAAGMCILKGE